MEISVTNREPYCFWQLPGSNQLSSSCYVFCEAVSHHMLRHHPSVYQGCVSVYFLFRSCMAASFTQIKCTFRCRFSTGGWVMEEETLRLLMRATKLMCPFGSREGDLKKSETLSERHSHCLSTDQSQSCTQLSSTLFRVWNSQTQSAHVLKFLLCAGRLKESHTAAHSSQIVCALLNIEWMSCA